MTNVKKIGLTALAASLVSFSANAGELTVSGAASIGINGYSAGEKANAPKSFTMGNQFTVSGGGELDNGMTVSIKYQLDQGAGSPFDDHSVSISGEGMGTLTIAGHGGSSAASSIDKTVAGDIWDGFDGSATIATGITGVKFKDSSPGDNSVFYTLPSLVDGLKVFASYNPAEAGVNEGETGYGATYTGIEGLSFSWATTDINSGATASSGEQTSYKATYAYGPVTLGISGSDHDVSAAGSNNHELTSYNLAYTVSDELSIAYGTEEIDIGGANENAEFSALVVSYTSGGMTLTGKMEEAENVDGSTASAADQELWFLGAAFAF